MEEGETMLSVPSAVWIYMIAVNLIDDENRCEADGHGAREYDFWIKCMSVWRTEGIDV